MFIFVDVLSMCTFTVYVLYIVDQWCKFLGMTMLAAGWLLTCGVVVDFYRPYETQDELNRRLCRASKTSVIMDVLGKMLTYYMELKRQEGHLPKWVVGLELPTTLIEAVIKWEHAQYSRIYRMHRVADNDVQHALLSHEPLESGA